MNDENAIFCLYLISYINSDVETMNIFFMEFMKDCCSFYPCNCTILNACFIFNSNDYYVIILKITCIGPVVSIDTKKNRQNENNRHHNRVEEFLKAFKVIVIEIK